MELTNQELEVILSALSDQIMADELPADDMKKVMTLHNKIGKHLIAPKKITTAKEFQRRLEAYNKRNK